MGVLKMRPLHIFFSLMILLFVSFFVSCSTEVSFTLTTDDSVEIRFAGGAGEAFSKMISQAAGAEADSVIDTTAVTYELAKAGFSNVKVEQKAGGTVFITMTDLNKSSYIFTSGILKIEKGKLKTAITRKSLENFYLSADEQTRTTLDLFLAPVFNNEKMSEAEYLEMVGSFYGSAASKEVAESSVKINLTGRDGKTETQRIPLVKLLCGSF